MSLKRFSYLGLLIAALIVAACSPQAAPEPTAAPEPAATPEPTAKPLPPTATSAPAATTSAPIISVGEAPMGFTEDGAPYQGNPDAPVTLTEYSDYQ